VTAAERPLVGVVGRALRGGRVQRWPEDALAIQAPYLDAVRRGGGEPVVLQPAELSVGDAAALLARLDALVLTGGPDVDPARYGQRPHREVYGVDPVADAFELALTHAACHQALPTLAICRGIQVLNVALGGTLDQHLADRAGVGDHGVPAVDDGSARHPVELEADSTVARAMGDLRPVCSSHHHQALDRLGDGLRVTGRAADGVVEAVELDGAPSLLAVQWHPEDTAASDPAQQRLFDALVAHAAER
jgi:putative glutamine amidotransferase